MHADIQGSLDQINKWWRVFEHKGKSMAKEEVRAVLEYGKSKGYKTTDQITEEEVETSINHYHQ